MGAFRRFSFAGPLLALIAVSACGDDPVEPRVQPDAVWTQLSVGAHHACAIDDEARAFCWGWLVQDGSEETTPVAVAGGHRWLAIAAGSSATCGVTEDRDLYCWGLHPILGSEPQLAPVLIDGAAQWADVSLGQLLCARTTTGQASCTAWLTPSVLEPIAPDTQWASVSAGSQHACGITAAGNGYCWGRNSYGELSLPSDSVSHHPDLHPIDVAGGWDALQAGFHFTCGIRNANGRLLCWGYNESGELGVDGVFETHVPVEPVPGVVASAVTVGLTGWDARHVSCAGYGAANAWYCWGDGSQPIVVAPPADEQWTVIDAGVNQACGIAGSRIHCWGGLWDGATGVVLPDPSLVALPEPA